MVEDYDIDPLINNHNRFNHTIMNQMSLKSGAHMLLSCISPIADNGELSCSLLFTEFLQTMTKWRTCVINPSFILTLVIVRWTTGKKRALKRWVLTFCIGVVQALTAAACNFSSKSLSRHKFESVYGLLAASNNNVDESSMATDDLFQADDEPSRQDDAEPTASGFGGSAFLAFLFYQTIFAAIASIFVWIEPVSSGSGIPEVKCYLNGIDLPRVVRLKTMVCKVVGVTFSVAAGLPVGKEGPMVHSGAVVAASISQGRTKFWGVDTSFSKFSDFRNDREKRDFVACGAAAGVCSAFGAPIGGVLFSLEEGASYWSTKLTWRAFFCAMITLGTLFAVRNFDSMWGQANVEKLFSFGEFNSLT